jgi:hypothetical protein
VPRGGRPGTLFNRLFQAAGDPSLPTQRGSGSSGRSRCGVGPRPRRYEAWQLGDGQVTWIADPPAQGPPALPALLAATTAVSREWDRVLLVVYRRLPAP